MTKSDAAMYDAVIEAVKDGGESKEDRGALEIGSVPDRGPAAALHILYPAADDDLIEDGEGQLGRAIPKEYAAFLKKANGLDAFAESFQLFGIRPRTDKIAHPSDLVLPNVKERPDGATDDMFFFAFYDWDGSLLYVDESRGGRVFRTERESVEPIGEWDSVARAIHDEFFRLAKLFEDGFDEDEKTVPE